MEPLPPLRDIARPFEAPKLPAGRPEADYVDAFLSVFGAARGKPVIYRDASGHVIPIGEELFQRPDGSSKLAKHGRERGPDLARMAEAIADPDEIWISWGVGPDGKPRLVRRYLRSSPDSPEYASFGWTFDRLGRVDRLRADEGQERQARSRLSGASAQWRADLPAAEKMRAASASHYIARGSF